MESLAAGPAAAAAAAPPEHQRQPQLRHQAQLSIDSGGNKAATDEAAPPKVAAASPAAFNASSDHAVAVDTPAIGSGSRSSSSSDKLFAVRVETVGQLERALAAARGPQHADSLCFIEVVLPATDEDARLAEFGRLLAGV